MVRCFRTCLETRKAPDVHPGLRGKMDFVRQKGGVAMLLSELSSNARDAAHDQQDG
jgi:hypothetical protein